MSQDREKKYLYFNVGLLKNSFALDALQQDALKYHMVDQAGQLIALRLTEYYEMMTRGVLPPSTGVPFAATPIASGKRDGTETLTATNSTGSNDTSPTIGQVDAYPPDEENIVATSPDAEQNADEAAEYWARM